ncbi:MAG: dihydrodipicolinate synthase family protein [Roseiflexus sp.]|nr:dihydrodipicolinate synthase family protein [Roseiflexus sp.]MCS7287787.1 dihydrodipicolinate synthase family protein [Roseiflexus sp.]MDW8145698.1 dihydrodipicolinate synthase family protein [Roseiflexaceae bacterium]MDW8232139.1 dihydrodipicolinate synthase family protein [Roseiflexaceae bacterium]
MGAPELFVASVTPFTSPSGAVDHSFIVRHLRWLEAQGVDGVVPCGTTGEGQSLSVAERMAIFDTVMQHRGRLRVFAGTGCAALSDTIALTRYAIERGADAALVLPPFYFKNLSDAGLLGYYRALCDALPSGARLILYHIPPISHVPITSAVIEGLYQSHPHMVYGLKDSGGDPAYLAALTQRFPGLRVYVGNAELLAQALRDGAAGGIFALSNVFPREMRAVMTAYLTGSDVEAAQQRVTALSQALKPYSAPPAIKALLAYLTDLPRASSRFPLVDLAPDEAEALWAAVQQVSHVERLSDV